MPRNNSLPMCRSIVLHLCLLYQLGALYGAQTDSGSPMHSVPLPAGTQRLTWTSCTCSVLNQARLPLVQVRPPASPVQLAQSTTVDTMAWCCRSDLVTRHPQLCSRPCIDHEPCRCCLAAVHGASAPQACEA